ncbi:MAG: hypothetical protein K2X81_21990, partial [Candidatus Obscuribacterales bacterium]|nr:hypothetical protein [Candidatus Obscuribacterales bacterium]
MKPSEQVSGGLLKKALYPLAIAAFALSAVDILLFCLFRFEQLENSLLMGGGVLIVDAFVLFGVLRSCTSSIQPLLSDIEDSSKLIDKISGTSVGLPHAGSSGSSF